MVPWLVDVPQTRVASDDVRQALRGLDASAEVIYLGFGRWAVGRVRPTRDSIRIATGMLANYWQMSEKARASKRSVQRYRFALACLQGFRPVAQYDLRELDGRVVRDFQVSQWRMLHQRGDLLDQWDAEDDAKRAANLAQFGDIDRAKEAVSYIRTSNFGYATPSVQSSVPAPVAAGRSRILSIT